MSRRLSELPVGGQGVVAAVSGLRVVRRRLLELGLVPGTVVAVKNVAPLGDPLEIEVRGCRLSIRHSEAADIELKGPFVLPEREHRKLKVLS